MKHFFTDEGNLNFDLNRDLLVLLYETVKPLSISDKTVMMDVQNKIMDAGAAAASDYEFYKMNFSLGGSMTYDEYRAHTCKSPLDNVSKQIMLDACDRDYMVQEYRLIFFAYYAEMIFCMLF